MGNIEHARGVSPSLRIAISASAAVIAIWALIFITAGARLALLGGSPLYIVSGALLLALAVQLVRRRSSAQYINVAFLVFTWVWAIAEAGLDGWALMPRLVLPTLMSLWVLLLPLRALTSDFAAFSRKSNLVARVAILTAVGVLMVSGATKSFSVSAASRPPDDSTAADASIDVDTEWHHFGRTASGTRFAPLTQITPQNVGKLKLAWHFKTPDPKDVRAAATSVSEGAPGRKDESTPLQIGDKLFVCTPDNIVIALDAETGAVRWQHDPKVDTDGVYWQTCRGVSYYEAAPDSALTVCKQRILTGTTDARLLALDAETGEPCKDFGVDGAVNLKDGMGDVAAGLYYMTSPPTIADGKAIVGAWVTDNKEVGEPSGVVRAFDAVTGKLAWAWDMGRPESETGAPAPGQTYTRGTPNAWSIFSADEAAGLVYIPTGNATPDYVGAHRKPEWEKYSSSVVALELKTGRVRWSFQTVHHDLWDYDVASQPVLVDLTLRGKPVKALVQGTKRGEIFVLDRLTGAPLTEVEERAVPQTDVPGEWTSKTQPFSVGMPSLAAPRLREQDMWGMTPFDQLFCRIQFRQLRYEGPMTPVSQRGTIQAEGSAGGVNWGSVTVDEDRQVMFVSSMHLAFMIQLIARDPADAWKRDVKAGLLPQYGTPYMSKVLPFTSRLRVPCQEPPFGVLTAIDLTTQKVIWERPLGTAENSGPLSFKTHLPLTIGTSPNVGGAITTRGGVLFVGAATDRRLRAIDNRTGEELWSQRLPEGSQATPMSYITPKTKRQMVVIVSGGSVDSEKNVATHVVAYSLE